MIVMKRVTEKYIYLKICELNTRGGGGVLVLSFAGYVPLASQSPCPIIVYFVASYRPHLSHFLGKCNFRDPN